MIASDRIRLDGLIHQWEEELAALQADATRYSVAAAYRESQLASRAAVRLKDCIDELRAALLVLGDARPHQTEEK